MLIWLFNLLLRHVAHRRAPDLEIGGSVSPYMRRWFVIPRNRFFNIYFHNILRDDEDRALHDHPWVNLSIVLCGGYFEHTPKGVVWRGQGSFVLRGAKYSHRLSLKPAATINDVLYGDPTWTLFITGPRLREWGFHCPKGWVHWRDFTAGPKGETVGRGCGE